MYSRNYILLFAANIVCAWMLICSRGINAQAGIADRKEEALTVTVGVNRQGAVRKVTEQVQLEQVVSLERVISCGTLERKFCIQLTDEDLETLFKIVQAEAGGEDREGKLLVANVVINRVKSKAFPNNVVDVVYQGQQGVAQFSPVSNGVINQVHISEETKEAVYSALKGEDLSDGALFFMARKYTPSENAQWFDNNLTFLFTHGGHDFYKR